MEIIWWCLVENKNLKILQNNLQIENWGKCEYEKTMMSRCESFPSALLDPQGQV